MLTPGWLRDCVDAGAVIEPRPKHRLHLSRATVERSEGRVDAFGDDHLVDVDTEDAAALVAGERVANAALLWDPNGTRRRWSGRWRRSGPTGGEVESRIAEEVEPWRAFRGCVVAFVESGEGGESEYETRRALELCVALRGGSCKRRGRTSWDVVGRGGVHARRVDGRGWRGARGGAAGRAGGHGAVAQGDPRDGCCVG